MLLKTARVSSDKEILGDCHSTEEEKEEKSHPEWDPGTEEESQEKP